MKQLITFIIIAIILFSCEKNAKEDDVDEYMHKVKSETYSDMFLPDFEPIDISTLLTYREDRTILNRFPSNPISSFIADSVTVGIIALWTIESIRISEQNGERSGFDRFPSLNPLLHDTIHNIVNKFTLQDSASKCYYTWWNKKNISQINKLKLNPLQGTNMMWR